MSYRCGMTRTPARRLAEVAKKVGVSEATVSRVLNGKAGVSESTRESVLTALDVLGYERPTQLRGERARLIGLVLPELQNPIFPALAEVIGGNAGPARLHPGAVHPDRGRPVRGRLRRHAAGPARLRASSSRAGTSPRPRPRTTTTGCCTSRGCPVVLINAAVEDLDFPRVATDDVAAAEQSLPAPGARSGTSGSALVLGPEDHMPSRRKLAAFTEHRAAGRCLTVAPVEHTHFSRRGRPGGRDPAARRGVTGIVCASDLAGARRDPRCAPAPGLRCPADVSVVGYDDSGVAELHRSRR